MNKRQLFESLLNKVREMARTAEEARKEAQSEANSHVGAMESRYDTFKEEAQYLAGAQLKRKAELNEAELSLRQLLENDALLNKQHTKIQAASIITLVDEEDNESVYVLSPAMGGEKVDLNGQLVTVLTPTSPLGMRLVGKEVDDEISLQLAGKETFFYVSNIS